MARLPVITANPQIPAATAQPRVDAEAQGLPYRQAAAGALRFADQTFDWAEKEKELRDFVDVTERVSTAARQLADAKDELDKDPDYRTRSERFQKKAAEIYQGLGSELNGRSAARFKSQFGQMSLQSELSVRHQARRDEIEDAAVKLQGSVDQLVTQAGNARTDGERQAYLDQAQGLVDQAQQAGVLTPAQHRRMSRDFLSRFSESVVQGLIRTNPGAALQQLGNPEFQPHLDPVRREALKNAAQARLEHLGAMGRAELRAEAADLVQSYNQGIRPEDAEKRIAAIKAADPRLGKRIETAARVFDQQEEFLAKTPSEQQQDILRLRQKEEGGGLGTEERLFLRRAEQAYRQAATELLRDPFLASLKYNTAARDLAVAGESDPTKAAAARDLSLDWQEKQGIPDYRRTAITDTQAKAIVAELASLEGQARADRLKAIEQAYGRHWSVVRRQLQAEAKVDNRIPGFELMLEQPSTPAGAAARVTISEAATLKDEDLFKIVPKDVVNDLRKRTTETMADFTRSLVNGTGGGQKAAQYNDLIVRRAAQLKAANNLDSQEAVDRAFREVIGEHYAFIRDGASTLRVPKTIDGVGIQPATVQHNLEAVRAGLAGLDLVVPPDLAPGVSDDASKATFVQRLQRFGRWEVERGGNAAVLMYEANGRLQPVRTKDGQPVRVPFAAPAMPGATSLRGPDAPGPHNNWGIASP